MGDERKRMRDFWLCFVPLFVAVDAIGVLPMYLSLTEGLDPSRVRRVLLQSVATATAVALAFLGGGKALMTLLGITVADFMIAGGVLLFVISITDLLTAEKTQRHVDADSLGAVPLGVPLIAGPAVLTTSILLLDQYGPVPTAAAIVLNIAIAGVLFHFSVSINHILGRTGTKIISKIASLLLASIGVMIVRKGILSFL
jgi:multiple antibiotic resistance protein